MQQPCRLINLRATTLADWKQLGRLPILRMLHAESADSTLRVQGGTLHGGGGTGVGILERRGQAAVRVESWVE